MENGWIKLHRKFLDWEWYQRSEMVHLFLHFMLLANHEEKKWRGLVIERGQFVTGRISLSDSTGISEQTIRTCINRLKSTNEITTKSTSQYTIITITKYDEYQKDDRKSTRKLTYGLTNNQPATNQRLTTNKNDKNDKNDKKELVEPSSTEWILEDKLKEMEKIPNSYLDIIATFIREKQVKIENSKQLSNVIIRYCRIAKSLSGAYTNKQIFEAAEKVKKDNEYRKRRGQPEVDFTLETFYKQLTK